MKICFKSFNIFIIIVFLSYINYTFAEEVEAIPQGENDSQQLADYNSQNITNWIIENKSGFDKILDETAVDSETLWDVDKEIEAKREEQREQKQIEQKQIEETKREIKEIIKHKVVAKETLFSISQKYNVKVDEIKKWNNLDNNNIIINQILNIYDSDGEKLDIKNDEKDIKQIEEENPEVEIQTPEYTYYRVKKGDTYRSIATAYNMNVKEILQLNNLEPNHILSVDTILKVKANYVKDDGDLISLKDGFLWPVVGKLLIPFGNNSLGMINEGINIAARKGTPVKAVQKGVVTYVGSDLSVFGKLVLIQHNKDWISVYAHLDSYMVEEGQKINKGDIIARVGNSGNATQNQLHFELRYKLSPMDPLKYLSSYR